MPKKKKSKGNVTGPHVGPPVDTRERILYASFELLADKGFDGFSASELARRSQVSKSTLFHHFTSIDEIPLEAMKMVRKLFQPVVKPELFPSLKEYLIAFGADSMSRRCDKRHYRMQHFFGGRSMMDERYELIMRELEEVFQDILVNALRHFLPPDVSVEKTRDVALVLMHVMGGISHSRALFDDGDKAQRAWLLAVDMAVGALLPLNGA